ncbi:Dihydroorotate dehydrogenase (quinone), mitochondrial [Spiromyces aspiralis]|uniref:Dihydroorotate dehydrogenase (Quinone), mitochondrial n=1 Tax=Spiromyces aspiralis TaxID=68401 RepID=A0ACC1HNX7_9FUNG|nr:Dihydroorotate dehydrogenase (quinone), mitochondrial [Spiromyces aspiralis]
MAYNVLWTTAGVAILGFGALYVTDASAGVHKYVVTPMLHLLDPEKSHEVATLAMKLGLSPKDRKVDDERLHVELWGKKLSNPIGMAAGFDKNCSVTDALFDLGFGVVEVGSVTPEPQASGSVGNPKPRLFRLPTSEAVINRMGLNNVGFEVAKERLRTRFWRRVINQSKAERLNASELADSINKSGFVDRLLGVNISKNHTASSESYEDYLKGIAELGPYADYLVINVSCPNVKNLGANSRTDVLEKTVFSAVAARDALPNKPPVVIKISPDNSDNQLRAIAKVALQAKVDGIITTNTTPKRPSTLAGDEATIKQHGGLSGTPLKPMALETTRKMYQLTKGQIPIVGCGGIRNADDAIAFARAGATIVQMYTGFIYQGPGVVREIKDDIVEKLQGKSWKDIIGKDVNS